MSNIFGSANLKVKEQKFLHSSTNPDTSMMQVFENMRLAKEDEDRVRGVEAKMENERRQEVHANIAAGQMIESYLINLSNQIYKEGREMLFKDIMSDIYLEAVYLDDEFKLENADVIKATMYNYIDKNGGFAMLEAACKKEGTKLLSDMKEVVEKTSRKCAMRKTSELKEACDPKTSKEACAKKEACAPNKGKGVKAMEVMNTKHNFDMTDEEIKEYTKAREKISEEEIVKLVKDKVLDVIKDEKSRQEDIEKFEAEIAEQAETITDSETQQKAFKESAMKMISQNTFADMTLFEAIQFSTMKEVMESVSKDKNPYNNLEEYIEHNDEDSFDEESDILEDDEVFENTQIDMDLVLAESITKYTLLEVCNTIKLEKFTRDSVQQLCMNLTK